MKVFKGKYGWETVAHNKLQNGEDLKYYMPVQFRRGQEPMSDSIDITPTVWWLSCYLSQSSTRPKLFISEWNETFPRYEDGFKPQSMSDYLGKEEEEPEINIEQEELPFY